MTQHLLQDVSPRDAARATSFLSRVADAAAVRWASQCTGCLHKRAKPPRVDTEGTDDKDDVLLCEACGAQQDGREDEIPLNFWGEGFHLCSAQVQRELCLLTDHAELQHLLAELEAQGCWPQIRRIRGLMHR